MKGKEGPARAWQTTLLITLPVPSQPALPPPREAARESWALPGAPGGSSREECVSVTGHLLNPLILLFLGGKALNIPSVFFFKKLPDRFLKQNSSSFFNPQSPGGSFPVGTKDGVLLRVKRVTAFLRQGSWRTLLGHLLPAQGTELSTQLKS